MANTNSALLVRADTAEAIAEMLKADRLVSLALAVADECCRSEIEIYANQVLADSDTYFDVSQLEPYARDAEQEVMQKLRNAANYIAARGDVFPWLMKRHISNPNLVCFVEKESSNG